MTIPAHNGDVDSPVLCLDCALAWRERGRRT